MADKKISELPLITTISGSIVYVPIVHDGITEKITVEDFSKFTNKYAAQTGSVNIFTANQTITANLSVGGTSTLTGNTSIGGNLVVNGKLTAQEIHTEITSASIIFESGSTIFGNSADDTHQFTGIVSINGTTIGAQALNDFTASTNNQLQRVYQTTSSLNIQTGSQDLVNFRISSTTGSINTTTSSFDSVFLRISSTTGSINTTTSSFDSVFLGISSVTGALNTFTQSFNYVSRSFATTGSNIFIGNQQITGSISVSNGQFNVVTGSGGLTSSLKFTHNITSPGDGNAILELRHNNRIYNDDIAIKLRADFAGAYIDYEEDTVPYSILSVQSFANKNIYLHQDTRLLFSNLTVDDNLIVKQNAEITGSLIVLSGITGSLLSTNGVVSSSNQLFELNAFTGSVIGQTNTISTFTASVNFTTQSLNTQTGSQNSINFNISVVTSSIDAHILKQATQTGSQDLINYQNSIITSSYRIELNSIEAYTSSLKNAIIVNGSNVQIVGELDVARLNVQYVSSSVLVTSGSNTFGDQSTDKHEFTGSVAVSGKLYVNDSAANFLIEGNGFGQTYLTSNGAMVLNPGFGGVEMVGSYRTFKATDITADGFVSGEIRATNNVVSSSTQIQNYDVFALNSNLYNGTGSIKAEIAGIEAYTASLKAAAIVSSSQQIKDYITFVNNDITSSMNVNSASIAYKATNVVGAGNRILFNNATDTTTTSAQLQWDGSKLAVNGNISFGYASTLQNSNDPTNNISLHDGSFGIMAFRNGGVDKITTYRGVGSVVKISGSLVVDSNNPAAKHEITGSVNTTGSITLVGTQTITGSLNVGVGTSDNTAGDLLVDTANKTVYVGRQSSTSGDNTIFVVRNRLNTNNALYVDAGGVGAVQVTGSLEVTRGVKFGTATGNVEVVGNLVMNTAGNGISFAANTGGAGKSSQLLNDYEEGLVVATITCSTSGTVTLDSGYNSLSYVKVGSIVHVTGLLSVTSVSSPVGAFSVPLPFAVANLADAAGTSAATVHIDATNTANSSDFCAIVNETETALRVYLGNTTSLTSDSANQLKAGSSIYISVTYRTS